MTRCEQYEPYLAALADEQTEAIPLEVRHDVEAHVASCAACRKQIAQQRQVARRLAAISPPPVTADRWRQVWNAVDSQTTSRTVGRRLAWPLSRRWIAATGGMAAAAMILAAVLLWPSGPAQQYAFATGSDGDIQVLETDSQDQTPVVITSGQEDVVVVWVVQDTDETRPS